MAISDPEFERWKVAYSEISKAHDDIYERRFKLLGLLPLASGTGIFLLLCEDALEEIRHFRVIGIFGAVITIGLFAYELRGIQQCLALRACGKKLEERLKPARGRFTETPREILMIGAPLAALLIYPTVFGAWVYTSQAGADPMGAFLCAFKSAVFTFIAGCVHYGYCLRRLRRDGLSAG